MYFGTDVLNSGRVSPIVRTKTIRLDNTGVYVTFAFPRVLGGRFTRNDTSGPQFLVYLHEARTCR